MSQLQYPHADVGASTTDSSSMHAKISWNYNPPVLCPDGSLLIVPNFSSLRGTNDKVKSKEMAVRLAKNRELPSILQDAGELTADDNKAIEYHKLKGGEKLFVGFAENPVFTAAFFDEESIKDRGDTFERIARVREYLSSRPEGKIDGPSAFEINHVRAPDGSRGYARGFTTNPQATSAGAALVTKKLIQDPEIDARISRDVYAIANDLVRAVAPAEDLELIDHQASVDVPLTFGSVDNTLFTTYHINVSDDGEAELQLHVGKGGGLHVDNKDDCRRWTALLGLGNLRTGYWPGRTILPALRVYCVLAPFTALVFKAVQPHISRGPRAMGMSKRSPYVSSVSDLPMLDPQKFALSRITCAAYARKTIIDKSPVEARRTTPAVMIGADGMIMRTPDMLPSAITAFGTLENMFTWQARAYALTRAKEALLNPASVQPSASNIARIYQWKENSIVHTPSIASIQTVLDGHEPNNKEEALFHQQWDKYGTRCMNTLSMITFSRNTRGAEITWVDEIGASLNEIAEAIIREDEKEAAKLKSQKGTKKLDSAKSDKILKTDLLHAEFGPRPYKCIQSNCELRYKNLNTWKSHYNAKHKTEERQDPVPSLDPSKEKEATANKAGQKRKRDLESEAGGGMEVAEERKREPESEDEGGIEGVEDAEEE